MCQGRNPQAEIFAGTNTWEENSKLIDELLEVQCEQA